MPRMLREWYYTLRQRFTPETAGDWKQYIKFSGFQHITEVVTLDGTLCPDLVVSLIDEDWNHNVHEAYRTTLFRDSEYLKIRQTLDPVQHQILSIIECPRGDEPVPAGFVMCGFDIMDSDFHYSTLTNCRPMADDFDPSSVNEFGLISSIDLANDLRDRMRSSMPDDHHCGQCEVWSIARAAL